MNRKSKPIFYFAIALSFFVAFLFIKDTTLLKTFGGIMTIMFLWMGWYNHSSIIALLLVLFTLALGGPQGLFQMRQPWLLVISGFLLGRMLPILKDWKIILNQAKDLKPDQYKTIYITGANADAAIHENALSDKELIKNLGNTFIAEPSAEGCPTGAMSILSGQLIKMRRQEIKAHNVNRNDNARLQSNVPGFDAVKGMRKPITINRQKYFFWHRTHLLPFRYSLSEGDNVDNLIITGTSHLNHGDRPKYRYLVPQTGRTSNDNRKTALINRLQASNWHTHLNPLVLNTRDTVYDPTDDDFTTNDSQTLQYSMDDIEQLADYVMNIKTFQSHAFSYKTECWFDQQDAMEEIKDHPEIPTYVTITMRNLTLGVDVFKITLKNIF